MLDTVAVIFLLLTFSSFKVWLRFAVVAAKKLDSELCFGLFFFHIFFLYFWKDNKSAIIEKFSALWNFLLMSCISYNWSSGSEIKVAPKSFPVGWACLTEEIHKYLFHECHSWKLVVKQYCYNPFLLLLVYFLRDAFFTLPSFHSLHITSFLFAIRI